LQAAFMQVRPRRTLSASLLMLLGAVAIPPVSEAANLRLNAGAATLKGGTVTVGARAVFPDIVSGKADFEFGVQLLDSSRYRSFAQPNQAMITTQVVKDFRFIEVGFGVTYLWNDDIYNSGRFNFISAARFHLSSRLDVEWIHVSNGGIHKPNRGRDLAVLSYQF
jgi:hypothetical protein